MTPGKAFPDSPPYVLAERRPPAYDNPQVVSPSSTAATPAGVGVLPRSQADTGRAVSPSPTVMAARALACRIVDSPGQIAVEHYRLLRHPQGQRPKPLEQLWLGLRKRATQMAKIEQANGQLGKAVRMKDRIAASRMIGQMLKRLILQVGPEERNHSGFRKEVRQHVQNMCHYNPHDPGVWRLAYGFLQSGEQIEVLGISYSDTQCLERYRALLKGFSI